MCVCKDGDAPLSPSVFRVYIHQGSTIPRGEPSYGTWVASVACMAKTNELNIAPSLLDRLLDDRPGQTSEPPQDTHFSLSQLKQSVARDLEALLNTRREALEGVPHELVEVQRSLLMYGLPDFTTFNLLSDHDRREVQRALTDVITLFEPRLEQVQIVLDDQTQGDRALGFRVEALLKVDPAPEEVTFDATLQLQTQEYVFQGFR